MTALILQLIAFNGIEPSRTETVNENLMYLGFCLDTCTSDNDAKWMLKRISSNGSVDTISYPEGSKGFTFKWSERANFDYKITPYASVE